MKNAQLLQFWVWCLLKANHKKGYIESVGKQSISLDPGQFIFGRKAASDALKSTEMKIRGCLASLENIGCLSVKVTNKFSVVTVCNWENYQGETTEEQPTDNQQITNKQPTDNHKQEQSIKNKEQRKEKDTRFNARLFLSERGVEEQLIADWLQTRKNRKLTSTLTAFEAIEKEAAKSGVTLPQAIRKCCENGWGGFKSSWKDDNRGAVLSTDKTAGKFADMVKAAKKEHGA